MLAAYQARYGDIFEIVIRTGSYIVELLYNGTAVDWNDPANPLFISIPVTIADGTAADGYVAVKKTASGNIIIPYSVYKDGEVSFQTPATGTFDVSCNARTFTDTSQHWAAGGIAFAAARGLFDGVGDGLFSPDTAMTRGMFAQIIANLEGIDLSVYTTSRFTDVAVGAWYAPAVEWAASTGIVSGYGSGLFRPDDNISREQMAVMLMNYVNYKGHELPEEPASAFTDEPGIASWAYDAVKRIQAAGIVVGKPGNVYDPRGNTTRAEAATIFANFISAYLGQGRGGDGGAGGQL